MRHIPSLDGTRAFSIGLVLLSHVLLHAHPHNGLEQGLLAIAGNGETGVAIFFVLSGYLITRMLLEEDDKGRIDLGSFYLRRAFRILPAFLLYVGTIAVLAKLHTITVPRHEFARALSFTTDYEASKNWFLGHAWSLSVEEQFYLLWPLLVLLVTRRTLIRIAAVVICAEPFLRMADRVLLPSTRYEIVYMGHTRADMLMFGCLAALLLSSTRFMDWVERCIRWRLPALALVFLLVISPLIEWKARGLYLLTVGYTLQGVCITLLMLYVVLHPGTFAGRVLNQRTVAWIGKLSYSLYLWQQLFLGYDTWTTARSLIGLPFAFLAALASFYFVEQPMIQLRRSLGRRRAVMAGFASQANT